MIVVDENIHARSIMEAISRWYTGQVISVTALRPNTLIKDDSIPMLLMQSTQQPLSPSMLQIFGKKCPLIVAFIAYIKI